MQIDWPTFRQHAFDILKAALAAGFVAALTSVMNSIGHHDVPQAASAVGQVAAAFGAIKAHV